MNIVPQITLSTPAGSTPICIQGKRDFPRSTSPAQISSFANQVARRHGVEVQSVRFENGPGDARIGVAVFCGKGLDVQAALRDF